MHLLLHDHVSRLASRFTRALLVTGLGLGLATAGATPVEARPPDPAGPLSTSRLTVTFPDDITRVERTDVIDRLAGAGATITHEFTTVLPGIVVEHGAATDTEHVLEDLVASGLVEHIEPEQPVTITATRTDVPWGLDRIDQRVGTDGTFTPTGSGAGVRVYLLDSGVSPHPDLGARITTGINLMPDQAPGDTTDGNGHGTHIAGVIAGSNLGVADSATVVPIRVLDDNGGGTTTGVIAGLDWVIATHPAGTPGIVNLSLDAGPSTVIDDAVNAVLDAGLAVVVAAGNNAVDACGISPARVPRVITVGAATHDATTDIDRRAEFSNHGPCLDLFAPGTGIRSTAIDGGTMLLSGTSIAAPHVTGALAATWGNDPTVTAATATSRLLAAVTTGVVLDAGASPPDLLHIDTTYTPTPRSLPAPSVTATTLPARVADTRSGLGGVPATRVGAINGGGPPLSVPVVGIAGVPSAGIAAVTANITVTDTTSGIHGGYVTAHPCGTALPNVSTLNFTTGRTVANAAIVPVGADGTICIDVYGLAHVIVDVTGFLDDAGPDGVGFVPVTPTRRADTRSGIGGVPVTPISGYTMLQLPMLGHAGIATSGATAVAVNITATNTLAPDEGGYVTAFPCASGLPNASTSNFTTGETIANAAIVPLSGSTNMTGEICVFVYGRADIIVDVTGYMVGSATAPGAYVPVTPTRRADTRSGIGGVPVTPISGYTMLRLPMFGHAGIAPNGASAVSLNITATNTLAPAEGGYVTAFPCDAGLPNVSTLNFTTGRSVANAAIVPLSGSTNTTGEICVFVYGRADIVVDVTGFIAA